MYIYTHIYITGGAERRTFCALVSRIFQLTMVYHGSDHRLELSRRKHICADLKRHGWTSSQRAAVDILESMPDECNVQDEQTRALILGDLVFL